MVQAADLLSAIHNSLHHGIQAQNDTTKGGNCLFCSYSFFILSYLQCIGSGSKISFNSINLDLGMFCSIEYRVYRVFMPPYFKFFVEQNNTTEHGPLESCCLGSEYLPCLVIDHAVMSAVHSF